MESQDSEPQPEAVLELSLSQLPGVPLQLLSYEPLRVHPRDEAGSFHPLKQPRVEQGWHENLQRDARALVILLQVECVESGIREVTFEGSFEGLNVDHYYCMVRPVEGNRGHQHWLEGPVNHLTKAERADYVAATVKRILKFLKME